MKANKRFITALLAVLTIFVLVPTMAFAANAASWGDKYATVEDTDGVEFQTERVFGSDGVITATPQNKESSTIGVDPIPAPTEQAFFYDLDGSTFVFGEDAKALDGTTWTQEAFAKLFTELGGIGVKVVEPDYAKGYDATAPKYAVIPVDDEGIADLTNWHIDVDMSDYEPGLVEDQTVTFKVKKISPYDPVKVTDSDYPDLTGTVATATITVKGEPKTPETAEFYMDTVGGIFKGFDGRVFGIYDGAPHTVVCDEVPGWTVSYQVYNADTGKWDAVDAVTVTDATPFYGMESGAIQAKAIFKKTGAEEEVPLTVGLFNAIAPTFSFVEGDVDSDVEGGTVYLIEGDTYDAWSFVEMTPYAMNPSRDNDFYDFFKAYDAANKKATEANQAALMEAFKEFFDITATPDKHNPNDITLTFEEKDLTDAEVEALYTKYETLFNNFGIMNVHQLFANAEYTTAYVELNWSADWEVEFVDTPTAVKYKAKKLKKKAASFTVSAIANNHAPISYKLIDAPQKITIDKKDGTITLAKGLKKGTYKIKVKAYVAGFSDEAFEIQNIKIKVKK